VPKTHTTQANDDERRPANANHDERRPAHANHDERRPEQANHDERRPAQANDDKRRPTQANDDEQRPTQAYDGPRQPTTSGTRDADASRVPGMFFFGFFFFSIALMIIVPRCQKLTQRRPTTTNEGQHRPTTANDGERRPTQAHDSQRRPTQAHDSQRRWTQANTGTPGPETRVRLLVRVFLPVLHFLWLRKRVYDRLYTRFLCFIYLFSFRKSPRSRNARTIPRTHVSFIFLSVWAYVFNFFVI